MGVVRTTRVLAVATLFLAPAPGGQVGDYSCVNYPGWTPSDRVAPRISVTYPYDSAARRFTYRYTIGNDAGAQQPILEMGLVFSLPASQPRAAAGWEAFLSPFTGNRAIPGAHFFATFPDQETSSPNGPPAAQIPPGQSLAGFSYTSEYPPGLVRAYVRGFAPIPFLPEGFDETTLRIPHDTVDAQRIWVLGPYRYRQVISEGTWAYCGGVFAQYPQCELEGADPFLGWMNLFWGDTVSSTVPIALKLSLNGATVFRETLRVTLNGVT